MLDFGVTLLIVAGLLALIGLLQPLARRLGLPHSVLLAGLGVGVGAVSAFASTTYGLGALGNIARSIDALTFSSEAILFLFLPVLLFQTGLTIDVRRMVDDIAPILALAVVAVVLTTAAVGFALAAVSGAGLVVCLMLGAIVATTDPVAVVGIFRELGAPRRLSILIEGESLLNDAAAIALFTVLLGLAVTGQEPDWSDGVVLFAGVFAGGAAVGVAGAWAILAMLKPLRELAMAEMTITLAGAYATFIVAEILLDAGVVAVVAAALVIGAVGRTRVTPRTWSGLVDIWNQLGFWASSLIFIFASMLVPRFLANISLADGTLLVVLVAAAFAARAAVLYGLLPGLSAAGLADRVGGAYKLVILWGGLRGAVTLALALAVTENLLLAPEIKQFVGVLATGFVLFTLLVNATTLRPVMRLLRLDRLSPVEQAMRNRAIEMALETVADKVAATAAGHHIAPELGDEVASAYRGRLAAAADGEPMGPLTEADQLGIGLVVLANRELELYVDHYADQTVSRRMVAVLIAKAGRLRDAAKAGGCDGYLAMARSSLRFRLGFRLSGALHRRLGIERFLARRLADRFETVLITRMALEELVVFTGAKLTALLGPAIAARLGAVLEERLAGGHAALEELRRQYPDYARALEERFLRQAALRMEEAEYRMLLDESMISPEIYQDLQERLGQGWTAVAGRPKLDLGLDTQMLIKQFPMFDALPDKGLRQVVALLRPRFAYPGERIIAVGERGDSMYFISSGAVEVEREGNRFQLRRGDFFGELAMLANRRRTASVTAVAYCQLLVLNSRAFRRFVRGNADLRSRIREVADRRLRETGQAIAADRPARPPSEGSAEAAD